MIRLINGAIGLEFPLQQGCTSYRFPAVPVLEGKQIITVSYCNANDVPLTPSGKPAFPLASDRLELQITDVNSKKVEHYSLEDIEWKNHLSTFNQHIDLEKSELILTNPDNSEIWDGCSVYLIFWYGVSSDDFQVVNPRILPLEIALIGIKSFFSTNTSTDNKKSILLMLSFPDFTPSGSKGIDRSFVFDKFISLAGDGEVLFSRIPVFLFFLAQTNPHFYLNSLSLDFQKSYIETISSETVESKSLFFNLMYL